MHIYRIKHQYFSVFSSISFERIDPSIYSKTGLTRKVNITVMQKQYTPSACTLYPYLLQRPALKLDAQTIQIYLPYSLTRPSHADWAESRRRRGWRKRELQCKIKDMIKHTQHTPFPVPRTALYIRASLTRGNRWWENRHRAHDPWLHSKFSQRVRANLWVMSGAVEAVERDAIYYS